MSKQLCEYLYYHEPGPPDIKIYCGDCLEVMPMLEKVDLVVTDPPYGIKITKKSNTYGEASGRWKNSGADCGRKATGESWDDFIPTKQCFDFIFKVSSNQIVFGANYFWENFYSSGCYIIWDKRGEFPDVPFCPTEFAWTSFKTKMSKKYVVINHGFIKSSKDFKTSHPTQKPSELFRSILGDFSEPAHLILDPFLGSGTTLVAAKELRRNAIGIEINPRYCEISKKRLQNTIVPFDFGKSQNSNESEHDLFST